MTLTTVAATGGMQLLGCRHNAIAFARRLCRGNAVALQRRSMEVHPLKPL